MESSAIPRTPLPSSKKLKEFCRQHCLESIRFFATSSAGTIIYYILFFLPIPFLVYLLDRWLDQRIKIFCCFRPAVMFEEADTAIIVDQGGQVKLAPFGRKALHLGAGVPKLDCFTFVFLDVRFVYNDSFGQFESICEYFDHGTVAELTRNYRFGRYASEIPDLLETYCANKISAAKPSAVEMVVSDALSFMGAFEIMCIVLVVIDDKMLYLAFLLCLGVFSKTLMVLDGFAQYDQLQTYLKLADGAIAIRKNENDCLVKTTVSSGELVPGDILELTANQLIPVDAVLVTGSCMVDEKDLTGDSLPRVKFAIGEDSTQVLAELPESCLARSGTSCVFTRTAIGDSVLAIVIRTGYNTDKGKIMRSVLMPKIVRFRFFDEALVFVYIMAVVSCIGSLIYVVYQIYFLTDVELTAKKIFLNTMDLFFSAVNPVLPFSLYLGLEASKDRLVRKGIKCSNKYKINDCGRMDMIFFDKTGTLTKNHSVFNGMYVASGHTDGRRPELADLLKVSLIRRAEEQSRLPEDGRASHRDALALPGSVRQALRPGGRAEGEFLSQVFRQQLAGGSKRLHGRRRLPDKDGVRFSFRLNDLSELHRLGPQARNYLFCLSFCNSLILSGSKVVGDNLDLEMFRFAPYALQNFTPPKSRVVMKRFVLQAEKRPPFEMPAQMTVERTFDYSSDFRNECVVLFDESGRRYLVVKGAPEEVALLCDPATLPRDFGTTLYEVCATGVRVLGLALRELGQDDTVLAKTREELVAGLTFCGLFALDNPLKDEAPEVVSTLLRNLIRCVLITGDNIFTAISIAARSTLLPPGKVLYMADVLTDPQTGQQALHWTHFDYSLLLPSNKQTADDDSEQAELLSANTEQAAPPAVPINSLDDLLAVSPKTAVLALSGAAYDFLVDHCQANQPRLTAKARSVFRLVHRIALIYGRCDAFQKSRIVRNQRLFHGSSYPIGYVGDGANDTEAMKFSDVALLMDQAAISFAASFSCADGSLRRVVEMIKEGKNNVESGYQNFKFFIFLTCGEFVGTFLLYLRYISFTIYQSMFMDIAVFMILCGLSDTFWHKDALNRYRPKVTILVFNILFPMTCHLLLTSALMWLGFQHLTTLSFYKPPLKLFNDADTKDLDVDVDVYSFFDNHFLFCLMNLFFVSYFAISNFRNQFRVSLAENRPVLFYLVGFAAFICYLCNLSEKQHPNAVDHFFITAFAILGTFKTNRMYIWLLAAYWVCALLIEKLNDIIRTYRENLTFIKIEKHFIQRVPPEAEKKVTQKPPVKPTELIS